MSDREQQYHDDNTINRLRMDKEIPGFIKITKAPAEYKTSRSTILRRRDHSRNVSDSDVYQHFIVQDAAGDQVKEPSKETVARLNKEGRAPQWFVSRAWLEAEFGKRQTDNERAKTGSQEKVTTSKPTSSIEEQYEARIKELKEQLEKAQQREDKLQQRELKLLEYAQADKAMFAKAAENLTQVLALPGITEATKAQNKTGDSPESPGQGMVPSDIVDTTPRVEHVKAKPKTNNPKQRNKSPAKTKQPAKEQPTTFAHRARRWLLGSQ